MLSLKIMLMHVLAKMISLLKIMLMPVLAKMISLLKIMLMHVLAKIISLLKIILIHVHVFFIDKCVQKFLNRLFIKRNHQKLTSAKKEVLITLEFLGETSLQVKKQLFRSCQKHVKLNAVFKSSIRIKNAFRFKNALPKHINSKVLYKFKCNTCNSVYIGKTKRHLLVRQYEHLGLSVLTNKALKYTEKDAAVIRKHCHQCEHYCTVDNFKIVGNANNDFYLKLK